MNNKFHRKSVHAVKMSFIFSMIFLLMNCSGTQDIDPGHPAPSANESGNGHYQAPASKYAAEILSYMMQVVVGAAGDPADRQAWKTRSLSADLDLNQVRHIMQDPERKVTELMVYDANILGLSTVLYHYNQRLNYFKGRAFQAKGTPGFPLGFRAAENYILAVDTLKHKLKASLQQRVQGDLEVTAGVSSTAEESGRKATDFINTHLQFVDLNKRPLVIYPGNAEKVIQ